MFSLYEILGILLIHWFADFVLQTDEQAKGKSKEWKPLLHHTFNYSIIWFFASFIYGMFTNNILLLLFAPITFICHTITDYITSRENSKLWESGKVHDFFVCVGFDQWLHYLQLFLTYWLLFK
jgi:L-asparagine transporter-like permease